MSETPRTSFGTHLTNFSPARPEGTVRALLDEWLPGACSNKEGKGDGTGSVPAIVTADYGAYWFGAVSREVERRAVFCDAFEQRCT